MNTLQTASDILTFIITYKTQASKEKG